jgi:PAS domain S-box-containing protein
MALISTLYDILTGVSLAVFIWHLMTGLLKKNRIENFLLAGLGLALMMYLIFRKMSYQAQDIETLAVFSKLIMFSLPLIGILLSWFVYNYTREKSYWAVTALSVTYILIIIINILSPYSILYQEIIGVREVSLPWGESVSFPNYRISSWHFLTDFSILILITYLIFSAYRLYRADQKPIAILWFFLVLLLISSIVHDYLLLNDLITSLQMIPMALSLFVVVMCLLLIRSVIIDSRITDEIIEKEERWERLFENVNLIVVGLNRMGNVEYINPYFLELTGYEADEVLGKDWFANFLPGTYSYDVQGAFLEILKNDFHPYYENPILTKDGKQCVIAWHNVRIVNKDGKITGSLSIGCDITRFCKEKTTDRTEEI